MLGVDWVTVALCAGIALGFAWGLTIGLTPPKPPKSTKVTTRGEGPIRVRYANSSGVTEYRCCELDRLPDGAVLLYDHTGDLVALIGPGALLDVRS